MRKISEGESNMCRLCMASHSKNEDPFDPEYSPRWVHGSWRWFKTKTLWSRCCNCYKDLRKLHSGIGMCDECYKDFDQNKRPIFYDNMEAQQGLSPPDIYDELLRDHASHESNDSKREADLRKAGNFDAYKKILDKKTAYRYREPVPSVEPAAVQRPMADVDEEKSLENHKDKFTDWVDTRQYMPNDESLVHRRMRKTFEKSVSHDEKRRLMHSKH